MTMPSSPPVNNVSATASATDSDLTAFNKLLHLVNKSQPVTDQVCILWVLAIACFLAVVGGADSNCCIVPVIVVSQSVNQSIYIAQMHRVSNAL